MLKRIYSLLLVVSMLMSMVITVNAAQTDDPFNGKKEINIVFIGGSITEGSGSSTHWSDADCDYANRDGTIKNTKCYAGLVGQYFIDRFSDKKVNVYNSGVSGTSSAYGRLRLEKDVIQYNPDMVFIEFAINDKSNAESSKRNMEGIVRELLKLENPPIINFVYTTDATSSAIDEAQEEVAQYYGIPSHNIQQHIDKMLEQGRLGSFYEISGDGTHPNDKGYQIYADFMINNLKKNSYFERPTAQEKPYTKVSEYQALRFIEAKNSKRTGAWMPDTKFGKNAYTSVQVGATITFEFFGPTFSLERVCSSDSGMKFSYSVDGGPEKKASTYGAKMGTTGISDLKNEKHTITIKVLDAGNSTGVSITGYYVDDYDNPDKDANIEQEEEIHVDASMREIYVAPYGDDANEGTADKPLKTLQQATRAASLVAKEASSDIKVIIREGTYDVGDGWKHTKENSGTAAANINYVAYSGETVRIVNSATLDNSKFKLVTDEKTLKRIPKMAHGKVYEIDLLAEGIEDFGVIARAGMQFQDTAGSRMLLVNGRRYDLAKWPNEDYATITGVYPNSGGHVFGFSGNKDHWATATEAWVAGYYTWLWADDALPVKSIDIVNKKIYTGATHAYGVKDGNPYYIYNLIEELDVPGEWFLDSTTGKLYFYPIEDDLEKAEIRLVTKQTELLSLTDVSYVSFKNINFEGTSGTAIKGTGLNHVTVDGCNISNADNKGISFRGVYTTIENCYIKDTGKGGINAGNGVGYYLNGKTFDSNHNVVRNNHTERFSLSSRTYSTGITVGDRQALVSHNTINNANHRALGYNGTENIIEYNDIYNVLKYANDMGAIYVGRTWTQPGNILRYNYIHDSEGRDLRTDDIWYTQGMYFDDMYAGDIVLGNTFENLNRGVFLHAGKFITIEKNIFKGCAIGIDIHNFSSRPTEQIAQQGKNIMDLYNATGEYHSDFNADLVPIHKEYLANKDAYDARFPWMKDLMNEYALAPYGNTVKDNIFIGGQAYKFDENAWKNTAMSGNHELDASFSYDEAKQHVGYTDIPSEKEAGIIVDEKKQIGEFRAVFPENNATDQVADEIVFSWEDADGANQYRLIVAEDENFEKVIYDNVLEENFKVFTRLKYDRTKYFWKVYAHSTGNAFTDKWIENKNGVMCFRTAASEIIDNEEYDKAIEKSEAALNNTSIVEGEEPGMHRVGSKQALSDALGVAKEGIKVEGANSPFISSQYTIDYETSRLNRQYTIFTQAINSTTIDIKELLSKQSAWSGKAGGYSVTASSAVFSKQTGAYGYSGGLIENYKKLKMKLGVEAGNGYACIGIRANNTTAVPWNAKMYVFLVKPETLELQKFGGSGFLYEAENKYFKDGALCDVEFGATDTPDGTQLTVIVNGETVFDILDSNNPILDQGTFYVYLSNPEAKVTIKPAN